MRRLDFERAERKVMDNGSMVLLEEVIAEVGSKMGETEQKVRAVDELWHDGGGRLRYRSGERGRSIKNEWEETYRQVARKSRNQESEFFARFYLWRVLRVESSRLDII